MRRVVINVIGHGQPDKDGRVSHDLHYRNLAGQSKMQSYFARPQDTIARLRHNIAENYWFHKMRQRLARENGW